MRAIQRGFPHTLVMMHISRNIFKLSFYRYTSQSRSQIYNENIAKGTMDFAKPEISINSARSAQNLTKL